MEYLLQSRSGLDPALAIGCAAAALRLGAGMYTPTLGRQGRYLRYLSQARQASLGSLADLGLKGIRTVIVGAV